MPLRMSIQSGWNNFIEAKGIDALEKKRDVECLRNGRILHALFPCGHKKTHADAV